MTRATRPPSTLRVTACPRVPEGLDDPDADRDALDALFDEGASRADDLIDRIESGNPLSGRHPTPTRRPRPSRATWVEKGTPRRSVG